MNKQAKESIILPTIASLLLSVKNTVIEYQAKLFPFVKALLGICLSGLILVSCASEQKRAGNIWWADYTQNSRVDCVINGQNLGHYWFNDSTSKTYGYKIPQGQHNVEISTRWSNGFEDSTQLTFDVKEGKKYTIYTHELQEGQDPNAGAVLPTDYLEQTYTGNVGGKILKTVGEGVLASVGGTAVVGASLLFFVYGSPIWVPYVAYAYYQHNKKIKEAAKSTQASTTNTEIQAADSVVDTAAQPPDSTPDTEIKPEDTVVAAVSQPVGPPPALTARPFDGCCYIWIEDFETREVVAGKRLPGAT